MSVKHLRNFFASLGLSKNTKVHVKLQHSPFAHLQSIRVVNCKLCRPFMRRTDLPQSIFYSSCSRSARSDLAAFLSSNLSPTLRFFKNRVEISAAGWRVLLCPPTWWPKWFRPHLISCLYVFHFWHQFSYLVLRWELFNGRDFYPWVTEDETPCYFLVWSSIGKYCIADKHSLHYAPSTVQNQGSSA